MATYTVEITRTAVRTLQVQIDAETADEARISALDTAGDLAFPSEPDAEYEATVLGVPVTSTPADEPDQTIFLAEGLKEAIGLLKTLYKDISIDDDGDGMLYGSRVDPDDDDSDVEIPLINDTEAFLRRMEQAGIVADTGVPEQEGEYAEIVEVLQASTAHLTKDEAKDLIDFKNYIPVSDGYLHLSAGNCSVYISLIEDEELEGVSDGFREVAQYARDRDISYIRFDRDAPPVPGCTTYNW